MKNIKNDGTLADSYQNFIAVSRYARWDEEKGRREVYSETVNRLIDFFREDLTERVEYPVSDKVLKEVKDAILSQNVMPSMRALMTAGPALKRNHIAAYNCAFIPVDSLRAFDEALLVLMQGTGLGFSIEHKNVDKLPEVAESFHESDTTIKVGDSKEGWAKAYKELVSMAWAGNIPEWDMSEVRPAGARLKTFGGRASGPEPLDELFRHTIETIKKASGRRMKPIEAHSIMCKIAEVVVVGGVRRCYTDVADISTPNGFVQMKDIEVGDTIVSGGRKAKVLEKADSGKQKTLIIKHKSGQTELTPNHRIAVFNSIDSYEFKEAQHVAPGDRLVFDLAGYDGVEHKLPQSEYKGHFNAKSFTIPEYLNEDIAWLIGLIHGDGHIHPKGIEVSSCTDQWSTLERANAIFESEFGVRGKVSKDSHGGEGIRLRVNSTGLALWFGENIKESNIAIRIPEFVMNERRDIRAAYLAGVLDSDGRVREDGVIEQATAIYKPFADDLIAILHSLGIYAQVSAFSAHHRRDRGENAKDFWSLFIRGNTSRMKWADIVGVHADKMDDKSVVGTSPHDFSYPADWSVKHRLRSSGRRNLIESGMLDENYPFAPVEVLSVEEGSVQQTWDIEVEDIHEFTADGFVTHNSALISLSDLEDFGMAKAKSGAWWESDGHYGLANNSAVYNKKPSVEQFIDEWKSLIESKSGERGIYNLDASRRHTDLSGRRDSSKIMGSNPCNEINLRNNEFCNLTEVIVRPEDTLEDLKKKVELATILGTWQSTLTDIKYLRKVWKNNIEEERLLGVSLTGQFGHKVLNGSEGMAKLGEWLEILRDYSVEVNKKEAEKIGIPQSAAITTVKPSGTVSQLCGVSSGMHPWHSEFYVRTVRGDNKDPITQFMKDQGIPNEPDVMNPKNTTVFSFPVKAPEEAVTREHINAIDHLELWLAYQRHWCEHKPSVTISVKDDEWLDVGAWVYRHFDEVSGVSFLPHSDHTYQQAPYQDISEKQYKELLSEMPKDIDWTDLEFYEQEDTTTGSQELACVAGACEVVDLTGVEDESISTSTSSVPESLAQPAVMA